MRAALPLRAIALALVLTAGAACGRKTDVKPPQLVAPQPIAKLTAENEKDGVRLRWERPRDYVDGTTMNDLAGFRIERREGDAAFSELQRVAVEDRYRFQQVRRFLYLDAATEPGRDYEYRVFSFTLDGYESGPSNTVAITREIPAAAKTQTPAP